MDKKPAIHTIEHPFPVADQCLQIGNISLTQLAQRVGQTPFYAYDRQRLSERVTQLRQALPAEIKLHYAIKANPMPAVVQHLATLVDGFDLASGGEMRVALDTTMPVTEISFAGPGKSRTELASAIAAGVTINVESPHELMTIAQLGEQMALTPKVAIRVNPDYELKSSGMKMSGGPKQFGIDAEQVPQVLQQLASLKLHFVGFHIFSGSQNLRPDAIIEAQEKTIQLAFSLAKHAPAPVQMLNIGGGFGIPYFPGESPLDIQSIGDHLEKLLPEVKRQLPQADIIIELGRYIVGEAGIYVSRIIDIKESRGLVYYITDGGLHHHLAASGNFGQVIRKNYPVLIGTKMQSTQTQVVSIVGPLCTPLDTLADKMLLPKAEIGDLVVILQSGAYGLTASPTAFLSHPAPVEVLV